MCLCHPCQSIKLDPYISFFLKAFNELHILCFKKHTLVTVQLVSGKEKKKKLPRLGSDAVKMW